MMNNYKEEEKLLKSIIFGKILPTDPSIDYIESDTPKQCKTCIFYEGSDTEYGKCNVPPDGLTIPVHPVKGCCNKWKPE